MVRSPQLHLEGYCGELRLVSNCWDVRRRSGRATIYLRYDRESEKYAFAVFVDGQQVNVCEINCPPVVRLEVRDSAESFDDAARSACSFTQFELERDPEQPGMCSALSGEEFDNMLEYDVDGTTGQVIHRG